MTESLGNIDPNVKLPKAVRDAAARSDQMFEQFRDQEVTSESNVPAPEANPELSAQSLAQDNTQQVQDQTPHAEETAEPDDKTWQDKYKRVNGRLTRANEQIRSLSDQISGLQHTISTMQFNQTTSQDYEPKAQKFITEQEESDYGQDFLNVVGKKAKEEFFPELEAQRQKIADLEAKLQGVQGVVVQDTQAKMFEALDSQLPEWRDLNHDPDFLDWLRLPDTYSGDIRHNMLKAAYAQSNPSRVIAFFKGFLAEEAAVAPAGARPDNVTTRNKVPLENFASPGRAKTATASSGPAEKPIFTRAQIAAFYTDVNANKYRGRDAEKDRLETQIFEAQRDGRIR